MHIFVLLLRETVLMLILFYSLKTKIVMIPKNYLRKLELTDNRTGYVIASYDSKTISQFY